MAIRAPTGFLTHLPETLRGTEEAEESPRLVSVHQHVGGEKLSRRKKLTSLSTHFCESCQKKEQPHVDPLNC